MEYLDIRNMGIHTPDNTNDFDDNFKQDIENRLEQMVINSYVNEDGMLDDDFTMDELKTVCKTLKHQDGIGYLLNI